MPTVKKAPKSEPAPVIVNIHPADELHAIREEIKLLTARGDLLRDRLLAEGASLAGDSYTAVIQPQTRESLDRKAITEAFGEEAVAPFVRATAFRLVKLVENSR